MYTITVLSGKGGVGKSSITSSLAVLLARQKKIVVIDCDVDTPNLGLCLGVKDSEFNWKKVRTSEKAKVDLSKCSRCKRCLNVCNFSAISWNNGPVIDKFLCEGCGACELICPASAITLRAVENGKIGFAKTKYGFEIVSGQLKMGESGSGQIVTEVRNLGETRAKAQNAQLMLIDAAPGIGCPVIASIVGSDFAIGVTEPTPSAFADLRRALALVEHFKIPYGIVINKFDLDKNFTAKIVDFAEQNKIPLLGKIPYDAKFVEAIVNLTPPVVWEKKLEKYFEKIIYNLFEVSSHSKF